MKVDVAIVGGGMVGLSLARALAQHSLTVAVVQDSEPQLEWSAQEYTARVSAINLSSYDFLQALDVWSSPLKHMQVWSGDAEINFDAMLIGAFELGFIVENRALVRALYLQCQQSPQVQLLCPVTPKVYELHATGVMLSCDQVTIDAQLLVGADGAHSWLREQMQVGVESRPYAQDAIVAVVRSEQAHVHTALQNFMPSGPLGVLPLADNHHVAIVWSCDTAEADRLMQLSDKHFNFALTNAMQNKLGFMQLLSSRQRIPLIMRHARHYYTPRCVLLGDAAHTIHPLAGQGVNCGFSDARCLLNNLLASREAKQFASMKYCRRYERERKAANVQIIALMRAFKEFSADANPLVTAIRSQGFNWVNQLDLLKRWFMRVATTI